MNVNTIIASLILLVIVVAVLVSLTGSQAEIIGGVTTGQELQNCCNNFRVSGGCESEKQIDLASINCPGTDKNLKQLAEESGLNVDDTNTLFIQLRAKCHC